MATIVRVLLAGLLGATGVVIVLRAAGTHVGHPWAAVLTLFPWLVALTLTATVAAAALRWWPAAGAGALLTLLGAGLLVPRMVAAPATEAAGPELTVAVANLRVGSADAAAVVAAVARYDVDVLLTLELTDRAISELGRAGLADHLPEQVLEPSRFTSGGGIHSRLPLAAMAPSRDRGFGQTPRAVVRVDDTTEVVLQGVHPLPPIRADWTEQWARTLAGLTAPQAGEHRLLAGDFNATLDHPQLRQVLARGWVDAADAVGAGLVPTFHGLPYGEPVPPVTLDHVLVPPGTQVLGVDVAPLPGSDHRLLVVRLRLTAAVG